jgi:hypothetical protein
MLRVVLIRHPNIERSCQSVSARTHVRCDEALPECSLGGRGWLRDARAGGTNIDALPLWRSRLSSESGQGARSHHHTTVMSIGGYTAESFPQPGPFLAFRVRYSDSLEKCRSLRECAYHPSVQGLSHITRCEVTFSRPAVL